MKGGAEKLCGVSLMSALIFLEFKGFAIVQGLLTLFVCSEPA